MRRSNIADNSPRLISDSKKTHKKNEKVRLLHSNDSEMSNQVFRQSYTIRSRVIDKALRQLSAPVTFEETKPNQISRIAIITMS